MELRFVPIPKCAVTTQAAQIFRIAQSCSIRQRLGRRPEFPHAVRVVRQSSRPKSDA
jgi:hypothetical protein